eukprot:TRINITY_DN69509_c0_g1_i1.p1 TRINITY_DN69509_c0_g1~~TRINITY_DN69509_c0_g1_i1.p1  ORF type:complete len:302 (-),score=56.24 TRINITY_DN69509_c0_g1_i1:265-1170(-)
MSRFVTSMTRGLFPLAHATRGVPMFFRASRPLAFPGSPPSGKVDGRGDDPFHLLGLPSAYDLTKVDLQKIKKDLLAQHHPDRQKKGGSIDTDAQSDASDDGMYARISHAVDTLADPSSRAVAFLQSRFRNNRNVTIDLAHQRASSEVLEMLMDANEEVDNVVHECGAGDDHSAATPKGHHMMSSHASNTATVNADGMRRLHKLRDSLESKHRDARERMDATVQRAVAANPVSADDADAAKAGVYDLGSGVGLPPTHGAGGAADAGAQQIAVDEALSTISTYRLLNTTMRRIDALIQRTEHR